MNGVSVRIDVVKSSRDWRYVRHDDVVDPAQVDAARRLRVQRISAIGRGGWAGVAHTCWQFSGSRANEYR